MMRDKRLNEFAKQLRHNQTKAEGYLWQALRAGRLTGLKFRRQYVIGRYIVDFYCAGARVAIEIDGDDHYTDEHQVYDIERSRLLSEKGILVLRYTNREALCETGRVLKDILAKINERLPKVKDENKP